MKTENNYEQLLEEAYKNIKPIESKAFERFEIPRANTIIEGKKTIINNYKQIVAYLRRDVNHVAKYLMRELASPGVVDGERLVLQRRIQSGKINEKIQSYAKEFVICKECGKPDTELIKQEGYLFMHCLACGAKHSVRSKIQ